MEKQRKWTEEYQLEYMKKYRAENRQRAFFLQKKWKKENPERSKFLNREERRRLKLLVFKHYCKTKTVKCKTCGFKNIDALALDHIENNGATQRKAVFNKRTAAGTTFYRWLKRNGFPVGFQVLCFNCNIIKQLKWIRK